MKNMERKKTIGYLAPQYRDVRCKYYQVSPWRLSCSGEVFELLAADLIDSMYELGAYDMFYAGMID